MATELESYAAHCRKMAKAEHRPDCPPEDRKCRYLSMSETTEPPACTGQCVTMRDRALWLLLAEEAETYLRAHEPETLPL